MTSQVQVQDTAPPAGLSSGLYSADQLARRDRSPWTVVQAVLAPLQFAVFVVSLVLVLRTLAFGLGAEIALLSVGAKTALLYLIMVTGALWEHDVFGQYLFASPFFWEDVVSMAVMALHTLYLWGWIAGPWSNQTLLFIALLAYTAYLVNAAQFVLKFRSARRQRALASPVQAPS